MLHQHFSSLLSNPPSTNLPSNSRSKNLQSTPSWNPPFNFQSNLSRLMRQQIQDWLGRTDWIWVLVSTWCRHGYDTDINTFCSTVLTHVVVVVVVDKMLETAQRCWWCCNAHSLMYVFRLTQRQWCLSTCLCNTRVQPDKWLLIVHTHPCANCGGCHTHQARHSLLPVWTHFSPNATFWLKTGSLFQCYLVHHVLLGICFTASQLHVDQHNTLVFPSAS